MRDIDQGEWRPLTRWENAKLCALLAFFFGLPVAFIALIVHYAPQIEAWGL